MVNKERPLAARTYLLHVLPSTRWHGMHRRPTPTYDAQPRGNDAQFCFLPALTTAPK